MARKFGFSFSWRRAVGLSAAKGKVSRAIGIPLTKGGRQRKAGSMLGGLLFLPFTMLFGGRRLRAASSGGGSGCLGCVGSIVMLGLIAFAVAMIVTCAGGGRSTPKQSPRVPSDPMPLPLPLADIKPTIAPKPSGPDIIVGGPTEDDEPAREAVEPGSPSKPSARREAGGADPSSSIELQTDQRDPPSKRDRERLPRHASS